MNAHSWMYVAYKFVLSGLDAAMLAPTSKYQKWRTAAKRTECRNAFQCVPCPPDLTSVQELLMVTLYAGTRLLRWKGRRIC